MSTGPVSIPGKAAASRNAARHGILSRNLVLDDEDPAEFAALLDELGKSLLPVGLIEQALVDRIAIGLWRQRRLVKAEAAQTALHRLIRKIAQSASTELGRGYGSEVKSEDFAPFDVEQEQWCRSIISELESGNNFRLDKMQVEAPLANAQLLTDAAEADEVTAEYIASHDGGLTGYLVQLLVWCRQQVQEAQQRPELLAIAEQVRARRLVLGHKELELFSRYQIMLDNQLYKALRALREAQEWRLKTIEPDPALTPRSDLDGCCIVEPVSAG